MELYGSDFENVPLTNIRQPLVTFAKAWLAAERYHDDRVARAVPDWYGAGAVMAFRWMARATVRPAEGPWYLAPAPITSRTQMAYEELIEAECLAAELLDMRRPVPDWLTKQPGWTDGVLAALNWAWRHQGEPPIDLTYAATG